MDLIDDRGRLFGVVNVIDALAVLLVLAVVVAGVALLDPFGSAEETTRYATIDLGEQPAHVAEQISVGDNVSRSGTGDELTITDVYVSPTAENDVAVTVRAAVNGTLEETDDGTTSFFFAGDPFRPGREVTLETTEYEFGGQVLDLDRDGRALETATVPITVKIENAQPELVDSIREDLVERTVGVTSARLVESRSEPSTAIVTSDDGQIYAREHPRDRDVYLTVEVLVRETPNGLSFHGRPLHVGNTERFHFRTIALEGTVIEVDAEDDSSTP